MDGMFRNKSEILAANCPGHHARQNMIRYFLAFLAQKTIHSFNQLLSDHNGDTPRYGVNLIDITIPRLGREFDGYRIAHLSDIHFGTWVDEARLRQIIERINRSGPDAVVITGDFISAITVHLFDQITPLLSKIKAKDGVFAVRGNHDCWANPGQFEKVMHASHIRILNNSVFTIQRSRDRLHIGGLDTAFYEQDRLDKVIEQIPRADPAILLVHEPDLADACAASGRVDLQLSGHTHGGQIVLPLLGSPWLPRLAKKYPRGLYRIENMILYTNRGIGTGSLPWRYRCPAEIALITLRCPKAMR